MKLFLSIFLPGVPLIDRSILLVRKMDIFKRPSHDKSGLRLIVNLESCAGCFLLIQVLHLCRGEMCRKQFLDITVKENVQRLMKETKYTLLSKACHILAEIWNYADKFCLRSTHKYDFY